MKSLSLTLLVVALAGCSGPSTKSQNATNAEKAPAESMAKSAAAGQVVANGTPTTVMAAPDKGVEHNMGGKPVLVVKAFTVAADVALPYDMTLMQTQAVAEFKVSLGKDFEIVADAPKTAQGRVYTLDATITSWHAGNAATRMLVGLGAGRESADVKYQVTDESGKTVVDHKDTIRTNFASQGAGSTGTLAHPFADKMAGRIKDAKLK